MNVSYHQLLVATEFGGAAEIALRLSAHLRADDNNRVIVWIPGQGRASQKAHDLGLRVRYYNASRFLSSARLDSAVVSAAMALRLRARGRGLIHVHSPHYYAAMRHALRWSGLVRFVHVQIEDSADSLRWAFQQPPDVIIVCAEFLKAQVRAALPERFRASQRIEVVPNSVDTSRFAPGDRQAAKKKVNAPLDRPLVLMLANLAPHKGQETAVRAIAELKSRGVNVCCWLAGVDREVGGHFQARLEKLIASLGLTDAIRLLGYRDDAPTLLQAADVMLLPSTNEGLPLTIVEAQATKTPVIAAPTAGIPEVIADGETGFLVAADDALGYADRIERLVRDPAACEAILDNAYRQATTSYNWQRCRDRICELYREVLEQRFGSRNGR